MDNNMDDNIQCTTDKLTPLNIKIASALDVAPP